MSGPFVWTPDRVSRLRQLYLFEVQSAGDVAKVLGCAPRVVIRKIQRLGLAKDRPQGARLSELRAAQAKATARAAERRGAARAVAEAEAEAAKRAVVSDAELIARAVAAGRVTVVPPGLAAGIGAWEQATGYVVPVAPAERRTRRFGSMFLADRSARAA